MAVQYVRMLEDREGSPNRTHVYFYKAGEVYGEQTNPYITPALMQGFIDSGHAVECDDQGNPIGVPADKRATKGAAETAADSEEGDTSAESAAEANAEADAEAEANAEQQRRVQVRRAASASK